MTFRDGIFSQVARRYRPWSLIATRSRAAESDKRDANDGKALIAITFDLEMSRNFPTRETTHWDYEKGNLNEDTKRYSVEAARRVKAAGGVNALFRRRTCL